MKKLLLSILLTVYILFSVFVTTCLLSYNDYQVSIINGSSLIVVNNDTYITKYNKGSLLVVSKNIDNINIDDEILYYDTYSRDMGIKEEKILRKEKITDTEYTYTLGSGQVISSEFIIGNIKDVKSYVVLGSLLQVCESKYGYLLLFVLPILMIFIYEIYSFITELIPKRKKRRRITKDAGVVE